jgi:hypothetical protein
VNCERSQQAARAPFCAERCHQIRQVTDDMEIDSQLIAGVGQCPAAERLPPQFHAMPAHVNELTFVIEG